MTDTENHDIGFGKKIYIVEDDDSARELTLYALKTAGMEGYGFPESTEFWEAMDKEFPDLILLDIMLPGEDGSTILQKLKSHKSTRNIPVIMTTAKGTEYDKVRELDNGADDYLVKPFGMMEMISRIKAVLRRSEKRKGTQNENVILDSETAVRINEDAHTVTVDGELVELTLKEYELLKLFMNNPGKVFTRDNLLLSVWNEEIPPETRTVDVHIASLRKKIKEFGDRLETVRGVGYRYDKENI